MSPPKLLDNLTDYVPGFRAAWDDPGNCFRDADAPPTYHALFAFFSQYYREHCAALTAGSIGELGAFVSWCMDSGNEDLANAAATCFIENLAGDSADRGLPTYLTGAARRYWLEVNGSSE